MHCDVDVTGDDADVGATGILDVDILRSDLRIVQPNLSGVVSLRASETSMLIS